jgi:hypothetical protein
MTWANQHWRDPAAPGPRLADGQRILRLADATVRDPNGLLTEAPTQVGTGIRVRIDGAAQTSPNGGLTFLWPALDRWGQPVTRPGYEVTTGETILARPEDLGSYLVSEVGICSQDDGSDHMCSGLYYFVNGSGVLQMHHHHSWSGSATWLNSLVGRLRRARNTVVIGPGIADTSEMRRIGSISQFGTRWGTWYTSRASTTGAAVLGGAQLYHVLSIYPRQATSSPQTIVVEPWGKVTATVPGTSYDWQPEEGERVWLLGDSVTSAVLDSTPYGADDIESSFRYQVAEGLAKRGGVQFVGHLEDPYDRRLRHSGVSGEQLAGFIADFDDHASQIPRVDIACLGPGINNAAGAATSAASFGSLAQDYVDAVIDRWAPRWVVFGLVQPLANATWDVRGASYSAVISALSGVDAVADCRTGFDKATMLLPDGVHPNALGHAHRAAAFLSAIKLAGEP